MHDKKQGKFMEGFFWGGLVGGGFAYLLSTQKGRDFLKDIIQNGMDALENATAPEPETLTDMSIVKQQAKPIIEEKVHVEQALESHHSVPSDSVEHTPAVHNPHAEDPQVKKTRFFKKSPKK